MAESKCKIGYMPVIGEVPVVVRGTVQSRFSGLRDSIIPNGQTVVYRAGDFGVDSLRGFLLCVTGSEGITDGMLYVNFYKGSVPLESMGIPLQGGDFISVEADIDGISLYNSSGGEGGYRITIGVFY